MAAHGARDHRVGLAARRLAETSGLRLGEQEDALAAERYLLYAAVSRPEDLLVLSSRDVLAKVTK